MPSTHAGAPLGHVCVPRLQGFGFVAHITPGVQEPQTPVASQTRPPPQGVPGAALSPSTQPPVVHETFPSLQGAPVFEEQELVLPHEMHAPTPSQVLSTPQERPAGAAELSTQLIAPPAHETTPVLHGAPALVAHASPSTQICRQAPSRH